MCSRDNQLHEFRRLPGGRVEHDPDRPEFLAWDFPEARAVVRGEEPEHGFQLVEPARAI